MKKRERNGRNKSNTYLLFALVLTVCAVVCAVFLVFTVFGQGPEDISDVSSSVSSLDMVSDHSSAAESITSEPDDSSAEEISQSYEEYIGVEYAIDISGWERFIDPEDSKSYLIIVNKTNKLDSDYVPANMSDVVNTRKDGRATQKMVNTAEKALQAFLLEAAEYDITNVTVTSAYRSYSYQSEIFNGNVNNNLSKFATRAECEEYVSTFSARPGTSEHQTGLACDMHNLSAAHVSFGNTAEAKWLAQNAHRFGFILRYPADKTDITGITYEPWHFRFVGRTAATEMYENGLCLEEYILSLN